jgi:hypothetical protein
LEAYRRKKWKEAKLEEEKKGAEVPEIKIDINSILTIFKNTTLAILGMINMANTHNSDMLYETNISTNRDIINHIADARVDVSTSKNVIVLSVMEHIGRYIMSFLHLKLFKTEHIDNFKTAIKNPNLSSIYI